MSKMSDLPRDLAEEVLSRVPVTSLRSLRSTCRKWNTLSKDMSFVKKHIAQARLAAAQGKEITVVMLMDFRVHAMRLGLSNNVDESSIKPEGKLIGPDGSHEVHVCQLFHCDGLLLCVTKDNTRLVVWNPYWGQNRWIKLTHRLYGMSSYVCALGYDKSSNSHKILRFNHPDFKIFDFDSDSWRVLDAPDPRDWRVECHNGGVSLKGNTYWFATKRREHFDNFLVCFDFTRETFGPPLPLPFQACDLDIVSVSSVREEQLAVLFQPLHTYKIEIWVTTKIEPDAVSWSSKVFLSANVEQLFHPKSQSHTATGFFIDEEKKVAVVFDKAKDIRNTNRNVAYIIGVDACLKEVDLGESAGKPWHARVCSYVPSLVQLD